MKASVFRFVHESMLSQYGGQVLPFPPCLARHLDIEECMKARPPQTLLGCSYFGNPMYRCPGCDTFLIRLASRAWLLLLMATALPW